MRRILSTALICCGLGVGIIGCQSDRADNDMDRTNGTPAKGDNVTSPTGSLNSNGLKGNNGNGSMNDAPKPAAQ